MGALTVSVVHACHCANGLHPCNVLGILISFNSEHLDGIYRDL